jgi:hypothetical protein
MIRHTARKSRAEIQTVKLAPLASELKLKGDQQPYPPAPESENQRAEPPAKALEKPSVADPENIEAKRITGEFIATRAGDRWSAKALPAMPNPRPQRNTRPFTRRPLSRETPLTSLTPRM